MSLAIVTGSAGLIGSEAAEFFVNLGMEVVGIDNDMRKVFFGEDGSTVWNKEQLKKKLGKRYTHLDIDIRDRDSITNVFKKYGNQVDLIIHTAAQPSHDWAARDPHMDFSVNATGTLNLLEATRKYAPNAVFIFTSTNKVYGDAPNSLPLIELEKRWEIEPNHPYAKGIPETMSIDQSMHSIFGASKVAADILVQEYGRYFGMKTVSFRGGCLTGPRHSGVELHGFLAYVMKCTVVGIEYKIYGYKGKKVRDNIHSADLIRAFFEFYKAPGSGEVYNIGGGRESNCSMLEAIEMCEKIANKKLNWTYVEQNRKGDHIWWISDLTKFKSHYPEWKIQKNVEAILQEIYDYNYQRWQRTLT
jgi:CDP-paratose 2-epimerase